MRLIDADALLEEMVGITDGWLKPPKDWKWYEDSVRNAPTIEAEPVKHGQWMESKIGDIKCAECGAFALEAVTGCLVNRHYESVRSKYCPNCGARMTKEGEEE